MTVLSGVNCMIGHIGMILYGFKSPVSQQIWHCIYNVSNLLYSFSFIINVFFYYFYNNHFRHQILINLRCFGYKYREEALESPTTNNSKLSI